MRFLGLDLGTQSLKAVVCDEHLTVRGQAAMPYGVAYPAPDRAEQDPRDWEAALGPAIAGALEMAGAAPGDIAAIAICGQLDGCIAVDNHGAPLSPALIWQDRRATAFVGADMFARTGQVSDASHMGPKIAWLEDSGVRGYRYHQPVSYLVERLTGEAVMDPSLASTTMRFDLHARAWIDPRGLPEIRDTCAIAGLLTAAGAALTGLPAGTPVAVGTGDDFANVLGAGVTTPGTVVCAIGTAEVVGAVTPTLILDPHAPPLVETHVFPAGGYFVEHPGWLAGGAVRWAVRLLGLAGDAELDSLAISVASSEGVTFFPALAGAMTPEWRPEARGALFGLAAGHTRAHIARAVLEGLAFSARDVVERLVAIGLPAHEIRLVGGGAASRAWAQLRADALGVVHRVPANRDACPRGAAMIAAVAAGAYADLAAIPRSTEPDETYTPQASLDAAYAEYRRVSRCVIAHSRSGES